MSLMLLASALVFFAFPRMAQSWGRMLGPRDWSRLSVAALLGGVVALEGGLGLIGSPTFFKLIGVAESWENSQPAVAPLAGQRFCSPRCYRVAWSPRGDAPRARLR